MLSRIAVVAFNSYREAVRARVLHGLFALALGSGAYALVVGAFSGPARLRVVSDLGAASISAFGIIVAVVLGATSLYRELEHKTLFPILARPIHRTEYLVAKYLGIVLTLFVFVAANTGALLLALGDIAGSSTLLCAGTGVGSVAVFAVLAWKLRRHRTALSVAWAALLAILGYVIAADAPDERRLLLSSALLTLCEVGIVTAMATFFAAFTSPFLTAVLTFGLFIVGRSADTLANLPARLFGEGVRATGQAVSRFVPNLMLYVPERPLLTGEAAGSSLLSYLAGSSAHALAWIVGLLAVASVLFRRRDFL